MYNKNWQQAYRNLPFKSGGRDSEGVDCYGLVHLIYKNELAIDLPTYAEDYDDANNIKQATSLIQANMDISWDAVETPQPFDVIVIRIGKYPCHIGIVYRKGWMIHCLAGSKVTCERYNTSTWKKRIVGFRHYNEASKKLPVLKENISIITKPSPFSNETELYVALEGTSLLNMVQNINWVGKGGHAYVEGKYISEHLWASTYPKSGERVSFAASIPTGGGDSKSILRIVAMVAIVALSAGAGTALFGANAAGWTAVGKGLVVGGLTVVGSLAVNALIPPTIPERLNTDMFDKPSYIINSTSNSIRPWEAIPVVLGTVYKYAPPLASKPWTEVVGADVYYRMLVVWGYGPLEVSDIKISDTPINSFDNCELNTIRNYTPGDNIPGWDSTVHETSLNILLEEANGYSERTITGANDLTAIFTCPALVEIGATGNKIERTVNLELGYREVGTADWYTSTASTVSTPGRTWYVYELEYGHADITYHLLMVDPAGRMEFRTGMTVPDVPDTHVPLWRVDINYGSVVNTVDLRGGSVVGHDLNVTEIGGPNPDYITVSSGTVDISMLSITGAQTSAVYTSFSTILPKKADYEVRVKRVTADNTDTQISDKVYWTGLQTLVDDTPILGPPGVTLTISTLRIKANEQLQGGIDTLNGTVQSVVATSYNTVSGTWDTGTTISGGLQSGVVSNQPGDLVRHILQSDIMAKAQPDTKLDLDAFEDFIDYTTEQNFSYNNVFENQIEVMSLIREICAAGRAMPRLVDGKWSVVVDKARDEYAQTFVAENIWDLSISRQLDIPAPHAWRVTFRNETTSGTVDERTVYDDGYDVDSATDIQVLELPGVTHPDAVWKQARYHIAVARLRPRTFEFYADMEHMVAQRGDLIELNHPTPLMGTGSGRVKSVITDVGDNMTGVVLTDQVAMVSGTSYGALFRINDTERRLTVNVDTDPGDTDTITFSSSIPDGNTAPSVGDICAFGEVDKITTALLVKNIYPIESGDRYSAVIEAVDYSPAIFTSASGTIPDFDPNVTDPILPERVGTPATPVIVQTISDEFAMVLSPDGSKQPRILVEYTGGMGGTVQTNGFLLQHMLSSGTAWTSSPLMPKDSTSIYINDVDNNTTYDIRLAAISATGSRSAWATEDDVLVSISNPPSDVTNFAATWDSMKRLVNFTWTAVDDIDLSYYEIREGETWTTTSGVVTTAIGTRASLVIDEGVSETKTYLIKAVDTSGLYSTNAASDTVAIATTDSPLSVPTGLTLTTTSGIAYDGTERSIIRATWDNNAEACASWRRYDIKILKVVADYTSTYATTETEFAFEAIANLEYTIQVRAVDMTGNATAWCSPETITAAKDETPPAIPEWSSPGVVPGFKIMGLRWADNTEKDLRKYEVQRSTTGSFSGEETVLGVKDGNFTTDNDLDVDTTYWYRMRAVDTSENESDWTAVVSGTTLQVGETDIAYNCIVSNHIQSFDLTALDAKITGTLAANKIVIGDINALTLLNGPAAAGADVTGDNTATFRQDGVPTALGPGDLWIDTNDENKLYRANAAGDDEITAGEWEECRDGTIATAQATADGKIVTFYQNGVPTATSAGDLWIDTNDGNKLYRATDAGDDEITAGEWEEIQDEAIATAISDAGTAQATADGKIVTFYQSGIPTATDDGDLWVDTDNGKMYRATSEGDDEIKAGEWVRVDVGENPELIDALSTTNAPAEAGADVTGNNTASDIEYLPRTPAGAGLYADATHLGYYNGAAWGAYIQNDGDFYFGGDANNYFGWDGSSLTLATNNSSGFLVKSGGGILVNAGGDITMEATAGNPSKIFFDGGSKHVEIGYNTAGNALLFCPETDSYGGIYFGRLSDDASVKAFDNFEVIADNEIVLWSASYTRAYLRIYDSNIYMWAPAAGGDINIFGKDDVIIAADNDISLTAAGVIDLNGEVDNFSMGSQGIITGTTNMILAGGGVNYTFASDSTGFYPSGVTTETVTLGTGSYGWQRVFSYDFLDGGGGYLDSWKNPETGKVEEIDDLDVILSMETTEEYDKNSGHLKIDHTKTHPVLFARQTKDGDEKDDKGNVLKSWKQGDVVTTPSGRPYYSIGTRIGLIMGAIRQIDARLKALENV